MSKQRTTTQPARAGRAHAPAVPASINAAAEAEKRAARLARQEQARAEAARRRLMRRLRLGGIVAAVVLIVGGLLAAAIINEASKPGDSVPQQASPHLATVDQPHAPYTTDPPTSGPHVPEVPHWGIWPTAIRKELQVHALEDAGVVVNYQPEIDAATRTKLEALVTSYSSQVLLSPYPGLSSPIVATAWTRIQRFTQYDEAGLRRFISAYKGIDHHGQSGS